MQIVYSFFVDSREKASEYGFAEKVVDGMHVTINSVVMAFKTQTFRATFQMSHLSVHSTNPSWEKASLRNTRIKDDHGKEVLTFKQITFGTLRVDADALYKSGQEDSVSIILKEYRMVFRAGLRDPCTGDVSRLSESVKNFFNAFQKSRNIPSAWITLYPARKNHSVIVIYKISTVKQLSKPMRQLHSL